MNMRFFASLIALLGLTVTADAAPATMRVDFYHSGNRSAELFSLDEVVLEALPWPGNPARPIDTTLRGKYLFEIAAPTTGDVLYSRSFSSIYGEWETTGEARSTNRTFHESLRFPAQSGKFDLILKKRDANNEFIEAWRTTLDGADFLVQRETAPYADQVVAIENNGPSPQKVDILLLGDGYTAAEHDKFIAKAHELTEVLFQTSPFKERRKDFNIWALAPASRESGVSRPSTGIYRDSPLGATYDYFRSERYVLTSDNKAWRQVASSAPYEFVEILTNSEVYGGGGIYGLYSTAAANNEWINYLFVHEFGHHFAGLADEYYTSDVAYEAPENAPEPYEPNVTLLKDPTNIKWKRLVTAGTPLPTPWPKKEFDQFSREYQVRRTALRERNAPEAEMNTLFREDRDFNEGLFSAAPYARATGAFEGALYMSEGYYRSQQQCIMFDRSTEFCRVCATALEAVMDEYTKAAN